MKLFLSLMFVMLIAGTAEADSALDLVRTAKAVKAIIEKGNKIPTVIAVEMVEQMSWPPKNCAMVIYERRPNTECPDDFGQGPFMDKAFVACFSPTSDEVDYVGSTESRCVPKP